MCVNEILAINFYLCEGFVFKVTLNVCRLWVLSMSCIKHASTILSEIERWMRQEACILKRYIIVCLLYVQNLIQVESMTFLKR